MPQTCSICKHPKRAEIDKALLKNIPMRKIAKEYFVSESAIYRHRQRHVSKALVQAQAVQENIQGGNLLQQVQFLLEKTYSLLGQAESAGDLRAALAATKEIRSTVELLGKLLWAAEQQKTEQQGHKISNIENALLELDQEVI